MAVDKQGRVYCEKPLGITPEQVDMALRVATRYSVFPQIGQQLRCMPGLREVIRQIHDEHILGEPFVINAQRHSTPVRPGRGAVPTGGPKPIPAGTLMMHGFSVEYGRGCDDSVLRRIHEKRKPVADVKVAR